MKKLILFAAIPTFSLLLFGGATNNSSLAKDLRALLNLKNDSLNYYKDIFKSINTQKEEDKFNYVYEKFKVYNENIDSSTVNMFLDVTNKFGLDTNEYTYNMCIAQLCVESGAKQHYTDGSVVTSSGNAVGISQIVPNTGYRFLKNVVHKDDSLFKVLGGTYYGHIINKGRRKAREDVKNFLAIEKNNLILWGYIMRYSFEKADGKLEDALLIYNQGEGFYRRFIKRKKNVTNFDYVNHIHRVNYKLLRGGK